MIINYDPCYTLMTPQFLFLALTALLTLDLLC